MKTKLCVPAFLFICSLLITSCDMENDSSPDWEQWAKNATNINTGVMLGVSEIIVLDRNVGALKQNWYGQLFLWERAINECPGGYHMMTVEEATALIASADFDTGSELISGILRMPLVGYSTAYGQNISDSGEKGYYNLYNEAYINLDNAPYLFFDDSLDSPEILTGTKTGLKSARCVKNN